MVKSRMNGNKNGWMKRIDEMRSRKGQVSVFVIVVIVIVAAIVLFFVVRSGLFISDIPVEFRPIYNLYDECVKTEAENALSLLGSQGGKIDTGEFVPGSEYAPFSSHLNFLGFPIPYWYYIAGNNVVKESVPSRGDMEREVADFMEERVNNCDFSSFYAQGFFIELGEPRVEVDIQDTRVNVEVNSNVVSSRGGKSAKKNLYNLEVRSKVGKFHNLAKDIYEKERNDAFLEGYAIDVLRLYAPVDGTLVQCSPEVWKTGEVVDDIRKGLESNIASIKFKGDYYSLNEEEDEYFIVDQDVDESVLLFYNKDWPTKVEVTPADEELMVAEPVGNQEGLGILGFCYVPYHFVYDVSFPVLIQINDGFEIFQFPVAVIIDNNQPREVDLSEISLEEDEEFDICGFGEGNIVVRTFDTNLNPIEAEISYGCFDSVCLLGKTEVQDSGIDSGLESEIPLCVNGYLIAKAEGFAEKSQLFSSNSQASADFILDREYEVEVGVRFDGEILGENDGIAIIHFINDDESGTKSAVLPEKKTVELSEGSYEVEVYVYSDSGVVIPETTKTQCTEVTGGGVFGFFGLTKEQCFEIQVPATNIEYALNAGGKINTYILESDLAEGKVVIDVSEFPDVDSLEQLQYNYGLFDLQGIEVSFV
jgi:hypothetical protein